MAAGKFRSALFVVLALLSLVAYMLPWVHTSGVSLALGAYDLAEWSSLTPAVRAETPVMLTSLLLRLPLMCIAVLLVISTSLFRTHSEIRWIMGGLVILIVIAQMPPFNFFTENRQDPNYQQQFILALMTFILTGVTIWVRNLDLLRAGGLMLAIIAIVAGLTGLLRSYQVMQTYQVPASIGIGALLMSALLISWIVLAGVAGWKNRAVR